MTVIEPKNERERLAMIRDREEFEKFSDEVSLPPPLLLFEDPLVDDVFTENSEIIELENGSVIIRELDDNGELLQETFGSIGGCSVVNSRILDKKRR